MTNIPESDLWMVETTDWANLEAWTITDTNDNNGDVYSFSDLPTGANRSYFYNLDMDEYVMYIANGNEAQGTSDGVNYWANHSSTATSLWRIGSWAFYNCHQLQNLTIPEGVTEVGDVAFYGCTYLEDMVLPSTIQEIGDNGFALCAKLQKIHVEATTPPTIQAKTFFDVNRQIPVYVPDNAVEAYKADPYWQEFNIIGKSNVPSAVDNISLPNADTHKLLRNGQLRILLDGVEYNVMGQEL